MTRTITEYEMERRRMCAELQRDLMEVLTKWAPRLSAVELIRGLLYQAQRLTDYVMANEWKEGGRA